MRGATPDHGGGAYVREANVRVAPNGPRRAMQEKPNARTAAYARESRRTTAGLHAKRSLPQLSQISYVIAAGLTFDMGRCGA
jgi:hypothetical protein